MWQQHPNTLAAHGKQHDLLDNSRPEKSHKLCENVQMFVHYQHQECSQQSRNSIRHKLGIHVPRSYSKAVMLHVANANALWQDAIDTEHAQLLECQTSENIEHDRSKIPNGFTSPRLHLIIDVEVDLHQKAWLIAGSHLTEDPQDATYSGIVSLNNVRITMSVAELHGLNIIAADVCNAWLEA
jgi:hypothetical protein